MMVVIFLGITTITFSWSCMNISEQDQPKKSSFTQSMSAQRSQSNNDLTMLLWRRPVSTSFRLAKLSGVNAARVRRGKHTGNAQL